MSRILILGPSLVNTLGMIRSCGEKGLSVHLLLQGEKSFNEYIRFSRYISKTYFVPTDEVLLHVLRSEFWNEKEKIPILCGGDDAIAILDRNYDILHERFIFFNCGGQGMINHYLDKTNQFILAEQAGFSLIKTWEITDIRNVPKDIVFPCLTKGKNSTKSTKADMHICHSREELLACLKEGTEYLVQEFVEKEHELNCVCMSYNQGSCLIAPFLIRKLRDDIGRQSAYFCIDDFNNYPCLDLENLARIVRSIHYEGIFSVEVIYSRGKYYFLEINLRNDGCGYLYTVAGCNYPFLWNQYATGNLTDKTIRSIHFERTKYMMSEQDLRNLFDGKVPLFKWIKQLLTCDAFYILNFRDPLPFIINSMIHCKQFIKRLWGHL